MDLTEDVMLFTPGRDCDGPLAVVLHEWKSGIETLDARMQDCPRRRPAQSPGCHTSFHYGIVGCSFHQYVNIEDTAWGFGLTVPTCPAPLCPPDPCESCTGLTADQYQPDFETGTPPTIPALVAGADGTANCGVIHVAVGSLFTQAQNVGAAPCCAPDPRAYRCLVRGLCQVFADAGITPTVTTLLSHCDELYCLDLAQLVEDIILCLEEPPPVLPPCNCIPDQGSVGSAVGVFLAGDTFNRASALVHDVTHTRNTLVPLVVVFDPATDLEMEPSEVEVLGPNAVRITFSAPRAVRGRVI